MDEPRFIDPIIQFLRLHLNSYLADLRYLVNIDSHSLDKAGVNRVNDWLEDRLCKLGFAVNRFPQAIYGDNLLASLSGRGRNQILLLGHSDTVFPTGTSAKRPMKIQNDMVMGPGVCDMKAGLLSGLYALRALVDQGFDDFGRIIFLSVSDEEVDDRASIELISKVGGSADAALTLEAARENGDIVTARKGVRWYTIEAYGRMAHAGVEPEKGRSAIISMAHNIVALQELNDLVDGATVNIGVIEGGSAPNIVPDYCKVRVDLRAFTEEDLQVIEGRINDLENSTPMPGIRTLVTREGQGTPPMPRTQAIAKLEALAQEIASGLGFRIQGAQTGGGSDAAFVAAAGTPVLDGLGPIGGLDHSPNEYIELSSIVPRTALLAKLIMAIANGRE